MNAMWALSKHTNMNLAQYNMWCGGGGGNLSRH
jgi:hypothetical protein